MLFSEKIRDLRKQNGIMQRELAKAIKVDIPMYSRFEHGERRPRRKQVIKLAKLLKTDVDELVALWLAEEAVKVIGNDKMADKAIKLVEETLGGGEANTATQETQEEAEPAVKDIVAKMDDTLHPHYIIGDALDTVRRIEDESIDCVMTTPPYWSMRRYGTECIDNMNIDSYISKIVQVMKETHRVLKPQGSVWLNIGDAYSDKSLQCIPWRIASRMIDEQGWILRNDVVWNKIQSTYDSPSDRLRNVHEFVFHFVKSAEFYYNDDELRINANYTTEDKEKVKGKTASGVTGAKYVNKIKESAALTEEEKTNALAELKNVIQMVNDGDVPDFRMFLREKKDVAIESRSEKAKSINEKGYFFLIYNRNGTMPSDIWEIMPDESDVKHYNVTPEDLCRLPILATCPAEGIVLDPYCGTGTTCKVANELKRRSIGIDINPEYINQANARLRNVNLSLF
jgi:DNA modification methylase/DNA-binding XRE family transcriptional regulator